jgi:rRNA maturation endonuclease Nob1
MFIINNQWTIKCIRCGKPLKVDPTKVFCDVCEECLKGKDTPTP